MLAERLAGDLEAQREYAAVRREELAARMAAHGDRAARLGSLLTEELEPRGKRIRPALLLGAYRVFSGGKTPPPPVQALAHALETFHAFVLVHDDVIDGSDRRRDRPTLHRRLEQEADLPSAEAGSIAIVLGNILHGHAIDTLARAGFPGEALAGFLADFAAVTVDTGTGEALELESLPRPLREVSRAEIERIYELKTSRYTVELPLWFGARAAGAPESVRPALHALALTVGEAFQLENDLHEATLQGEAFLARAYDFQAGVKTLFLRLLLERLPRAGREELEALLSHSPWGREELEYWHRLLAGSGLVPELRERIGEQFRQARGAITADSRLNAAQREGLGALTDYLAAHRQHSEAPLTPPPTPAVSPGKTPAG